MEETGASGFAEEQPRTDCAPKKPKLCRTTGRRTFASSRPRCPGSLNMVCRLRNSETSGKCQRKFDQLSKDFVDSYQKRFKDVENLPKNLLELNEHAKNKDLTLKSETLISCLENIYDVLLNEDKAPSAALEFYYSGGIELIADMLMRFFYDDSCDVAEDRQIKVVPKEDIRIVKCMLQIVYLTPQMAPVGLAHLCETPHLLHFLFSLLAEKEKRTFTDATLLLHEMFLSERRTPAIDMRKIACLPAILEKNLPHQQEAHLYHILATAISVNDTLLTVDTYLQEHDQWLINNSRTQLNKENHEYLINFKNFLEKLFHLTCSTQRIELQSSIFHNIIPLFSQIDPAYESHISDLYSRIIDNPLYQANLYCEKSARSDFLLLLSILLTGACREEMQRNVIKYNLIQGLEKTVDIVVWKSLNNESFPDHLHADYSDCGPETTVKIQYLRLIYSISDHHLHRYLLLNQEELDEVEKISAMYQVPLHGDFHSLDRSKCCVRKPGLLVQIIDKIKSESRSSYIRFWMTRALESFLRGSACPVNQLFCMKKGLLEESFRVLLSVEKPSSEVIQGHFDLLSCLMKDSSYAFEEFSRFIDCQGTFQRLCCVIDNNPVDSNMFIRCVVLTVHHFQTVTTKHKDLIETCRILKHYANTTKNVQVIFSLIGLLTVKTLSQENVSCLNTSIVILLVSRINGQLPKYLLAILRYTEDICHTGREILENLRDLLEFWLEHYSLSFKENDIKSLEESTGFPFCKWKKLSEELISSDASSPHSILHYLSLPTPTLPLKATLVPSCTRTS